MNINISDLKDYAHKLMFDMNDLEYEDLLKEFDVVLKQMEIISKFDNIDKIEPMVLPFPNEVKLRSDDLIVVLTREDVLKNAKEIENDQVKVPRVV